MIWELILDAPTTLEPALSDLLATWDSMGVVVEDAGSQPVFQAGGQFARCRVKGYFVASLDREGLTAALQALAPDPDAPLIPQWNALEDKDWREAWKEGYTAIESGKRLLILPSWLKPPKGNRRRILRMDPEMAFGSGTHETTRGCLEALERFAEAEPLGPMLDMGTGSGILAIGAALLGAKSVLALDNDPVAVKTCRRNAKINHVHRAIRAKQRDAPPAKAERFDVVVANILAEVLIRLAPELAAALRPGGRLILAGILLDQAPEVESAYARHGLTGWERSPVGDWMILTARRERARNRRGSTISPPDAPPGGVAPILPASMA
ncbi:MAG: 50S ribosomal protein L11 methyltransferase [Magnetococcales bacterium]|nr:50S ribosomal protein L11 methyltransferase [Magnetococcales bacterium]